MTHSPTSLPLVAFLVALLTNPLCAQTPVAVPVRVLQFSKLVPAQPGASGAYATAAQAVTPAAELSDEDREKAAAEEPAAAQVKQQRTQKLAKLIFDRRPSAILKAWSTVPGDDDPQKPDSPEQDTSDATDKQPQDDGEPVDPSAPATEPTATEPTATEPTATEPTATEPTAAEPTDAEPTDAELTAAKIAAEKAAAEREAFNQGVTLFQRDVTLGNWPAVKTFLAQLDEELGKVAYKQLLTSLLRGPKPPQSNSSSSARQQQRYAEKNTFTTDDVLALARVSPVKLEREQIAALGGILAIALDKGSVLTEFIADLQAAVSQDDSATRIIAKPEAARLLLAAGRPLEMGQFLPELEVAKREQDHESLNLLSQYLLALYAEEKEPEQLEQAWDVTQAILLAEKIEEDEQEEALKRAVQLAPKVRDDLGQTWLEDSFTKRPERGMEIIAAIGTSAAQGLQRLPQDPAGRLLGLQLQTTAVEALLRSAPERASVWRDRLSLLANNWRREADHSYENDQSTSLGPQMVRDPFGNFYYNQRNVSRSGSTNQPAAIGISELLEIRPSDEWLQMVHDGVKPTFDRTVSQLYLKVGEEKLAYPYLESLAGTHPRVAKELVDEFIRVWTRNHDPNASRNRTSSYMFMYGYERKADGIPLTRSKQQRNLEELAQWVARLNELPVELDEELLARAFSTCHSTAEVYRLDAIERVFGSLDTMEPKTLAEMAQQMRANLMGVWRAPAVQQQNKTNRKQRDIQAEVLRGYRVARAVVDDAYKQHPDSWELLLARASIDHDENNYRAELAKDSEFSARRQQSFEQFQQAAKTYIASAVDLPENKETTRPFEIWFYASLGACDLGAIDDKKQTDPKQAARIREAILSMPSEQAERHLGLFANTLFTRMSSVKPTVKFNYLEAGFEIVGDHRLAHEARKVYDYYQDLVTEIKLETTIDGSDVVGHEQPFGVFVNIVHTREIERESGGFAKYLQNQNNGNYYYNYGRPNENYREKFEEMVTTALEEQFDVLSVTFQAEDVNSRALPEYGWRVTPYAYLLLKARGPEVDKLQPLRLDLDFLDTSGYAVLPVTSPLLPLDAKPAVGEPRPSAKLQITQTLDERQAKDGKLIVEIKATGQGLIPSLDQLLDVQPEEFDVVSIDDEGVSVSRFDPDADQTVVVAERTWIVTLQAKQELSEHPRSFQFASPKTDVDDIVYQRYVDADLLSVEREISLEQQYGTPSRAWVGWLIGGVVLALALVVVLIKLMPKSRSESAPRFPLPDTLTPFTVLGLLKDIERNNGLDARNRQELAKSIHRIEKFYFEDNHDRSEPDICEIAETWARQAR